jgi:hypothetical protein
LAFAFLAAAVAVVAALAVVAASARAMSPSGLFTRADISTTQRTLTTEGRHAGTLVGAIVCRGLGFGAQGTPDIGLYGIVDCRLRQGVHGRVVRRVVELKVIGGQVLVFCDVPPGSARITNCPRHGR